MKAKRYTVSRKGELVPFKDGKPVGELGSFIVTDYPDTKKLEAALAEAVALLREAHHEVLTQEWWDALCAFLDKHGREDQ